MTAAAMRAPSAPHGVDLPPDYLVLGRASTENFPVASRLLPTALRADIMALYGWARLVDELGDNYAGDRLAALDEVERQLRTALGTASEQTTTGEHTAEGATGGHRPELSGPLALHPLVATMADTVRRRDLPVRPLFDLVQANRQDQSVARYEVFSDLVGYCQLSANPVGRMVLAIFGVATPERVEWSDSICTALQLVEHWQDVAEDAIVGRTYIPQEDLRRFGVSSEELVPPPASYVDRRRRGAPGGSSSASRALLAFEAARARRLLDDGTPLVASLKGHLRYAVAGFVAGGHAALDALAAVDFDIYADTAKPARGRFSTHLVGLLANAYRHEKRAYDKRAHGKRA
jgi:squalene synthase HpnC